MAQSIDRAAQQAAQQNQLMVFRDRLLTRREELEHALQGSGISADRFIRAATTAVQTQPELASDVSFQSLWIALLKACRDRLLPDGRQGAIIPYKGKAVWVPMYRGLLDRFEQSGEYKWITANWHREDDLAWDVWLDEHGQHFLHRPGPGNGRVIETYAAAITKSGAFFISVVTERDMERIRASSRARSEESPWTQWPDQMRLKSALRRLCKILPTPQPLEELLEPDDDDDGSNAPAPVALARRPRGAASALQHFAGEPEPEPGDGTQGEQEAPPPPEEGQEGEPGESGQGGQDDEEARPSPQQEAQSPRIYLETAHERGREARRTGIQRRAMPPEYRDPERAREATAWTQGWEGKPLKLATEASDAAR